MKLSRLAIIGAALSVAGCADDFGMAKNPILGPEMRIEKMTAELRKRPDDTALLRNLGDENARLARWNHSMASYREALLVNPSDRAALVGFAEAQLALGDFAGALENANKAMALVSTADAMVVQAGALSGLGDQAGALAILKKALARNQRDLDVRSNIALVSALAGDPMAYAMARSVAFAPDADIRHVRNLMLVAGLTGQDAVAFSDAEELMLPTDEASELVAVGQQSRGQGLLAIGLAPRG